MSANSGVPHAVGTSTARTAGSASHTSLTSAPSAAKASGTPSRSVTTATVLTLSADGLAVDPLALAAHLGPPDDDEQPPAEPVVLPPDPAGGPRVPLPPGTSWEDVTVEVDDHHLLVRTAGGEWRIGYEDAGFEDARTGAPGKRYGRSGLTRSHRASDNSRSRAGSAMANLRVNHDPQQTTAVTSTRLLK